jgi:hypothetical protein
MTGRQTDKLTMLLVVVSFLKRTDAAIIAQMPAMDSLIEKFDGLLLELNAQHQIQSRNTTGIRMAKLTMRGELTALLLDVASRIEAYSIAVTDKVLECEVALKEYKINKLREHTVADIAHFIISKAEALQTELAPYGVTTELLADLEESYQEYNAIVPRTRGAIVKKMGATSSIKRLFEDIDTLLHRIDKLVVMLRFSNPWFHSAYFKSRKIITRGVRKNALQGQIVDENGMPVAKATISVVANAKIETQSGDKGNYLFKRLPGGVWPVTVSKPGYVSETVFLASVPLLRQELNVVLKKEMLVENTA